MTDIIPAATILLLRDEPAFEVLMIERHADTPFAGGAIVFPGGRIEASDSAADWRDHCDGVDDHPAEEFGPRVAAIREAFEESGILLARKDGVMLSDAEADTLDHYRKGVEDNDALFLDLIRSEGLRLALDSLSLFARWQPPQRGHGLNRRYHTWFFAAKTPRGQTAREDGNEATEVFWTPPDGALTAIESGKRKAIFPTVRNLELLGVSASSEDALTFCERRKIETIIPEIVTREDGVFLIIPSDMGYPITEESVETAFRG